MREDTGDTHVEGLRACQSYGEKTINKKQFLNYMSKQLEKYDSDLAGVIYIQEDLTALYDQLAAAKQTQQFLKRATEYFQGNAFISFVLFYTWFRF